MKDNRSTAIKQLLRKNYPKSQFKVRIHKYSMGESINVVTDAFRINKVADPNGFGYTMQISDEDKAIRDRIKKLLAEFESVDRDESTGEILCGGNTFLFIDPLYE